MITVLDILPNLNLIFRDLFSGFRFIFMVCCSDFVEVKDYFLIDYLFIYLSYFYSNNIKIIFWINMDEINLKYQF